MRGVFVTGTDTGVGKTVVSAAFLLALRGTGIDAAYMKPISTGCAMAGGRLFSPDVRFVGGICPLEDDDGLVNPIAFAPPIDPLSASAMAEKEIGMHVIMEAFSELSRKHEILIVEGIGGIAVPLGNGFDVCDLIRELGLPAIVVMRPSLGTVNHTIMTVDYARRRGVEVRGLVVNSSSSQRPGLAARIGPGLVGGILDLPVIARIDYDPDLSRNPEKALRRFGPGLAEWATEEFKPWH